MVDSFSAPLGCLRSANSSPRSSPAAIMAESQKLDYVKQRQFLFLVREKANASTALSQVQRDAGDGVKSMASVYAVERRDGWPIPRVASLPFM